MKRIFGVIVLSVFTIIYIVSLSSSLTDKIIEYRGSSGTAFGSDFYQYGDLFSMSYLSRFQISPPQVSKNLIQKCNTKAGINLTVICDSYIENFFAGKSFYCGVDNLNKSLIYDVTPTEIIINPHKKNIMLLEMAERNVRSFFNRTDHVNNLVITREQGSSAQHDKNSVTFSFLELKNLFFNSMVSTNLELNTWEYSLFTPIKEFKADINYKLFNLVDGNVVISPDEAYLFYKPTVDSNVSKSSFQVVHDGEVTTIVDKINQIYGHCRQLGFDEIYLSIIPNPVSVLSPGYKGMTYNKLLERIQNSPGLKMPYIDIYSDFKNSSVPVYQRSDSHWNMDGAYIWLNKFNGILAAISK